MTTRSTIDPIAMVAQADALLLVGRLMSWPHRLDEWAESISSSDLHELVIAAGLDQAMSDRLWSMLESRSAISSADWARERTRLFGGPVACPINETAYVRRDKGAIIGDICGFYQACGFEPEHTSGEKADHLLTELEFVAMLLLMETQARHAGAADQARIVHDALEAFLRDHLSEWIAPFCFRLTQSTRLPAMIVATELLVAVWDRLAQTHDAPTFEELAARPAGWSPSDEDDGTPYECDMAHAHETPLVTLTGPHGSGLPTND